MITAFYEDLATSSPLRLPFDEARSRWGDSLDGLADRGWVQVQPCRDGDRWVQACGGCERELHREGDRWLALCLQEVCEPLVVDGRQVQTTGALPAALGQLCGVGPGAERASLFVLGERRVGRHAFLFVWCPTYWQVDAVHLDSLVDDHTPDLLLLLVPHASVSHRFPTRRRGRTRVVALGLDEVLADPEALDLSEIWLRYGLGTLELLWPRYELVVAGERVLWAGRWVDLSRSPSFRVLFEALLPFGDRYANRGELLPTVFPDEFTSTGRVRTDLVKLDRRLRQLVSRFNAHVGAHPDGRSLVGNLRARSDIEGGYRLEVPRDRRFVSEEEPDV